MSIRRRLENVMKRLGKHAERGPITEREAQMILQNLIGDDERPIEEIVEDYEGEPLPIKN